MFSTSGDRLRNEVFEGSRISAGNIVLYLYRLQVLRSARVSVLCCRYLCFIFSYIPSREQRRMRRKPGGISQY